ncbi:PREDICTED: leucine-rich repeat neuronal protein 4 [Myotis brandtii]|uniref:leucine-rich repeat neuronal protein 4 n=1 Tax=Myotis brandtii TaxID=109478 RepID=UPI0003BB928F|nr:PREDICTED: leucine-rich repeat neuronal protein 4 [Myotis brandtii]
MWLTLLLLLPTALRLSLAEPPQERVPLFRLIQLGPWGSGANDTTGSPCQGLFATGATTLNLANRSLEHLPVSGTALGQGDIADAAFAPLASLEVLDLSGTLLKQVQPRWMGDLPKLTSLYLRKMPMLRSLEGDIFKMTSDLQQLDCQDSLALTSVQTHIFQDTPRLQLLLLQNCNLSSFPPWTLHSSQVLSINLFGNPLTCSCELSWLLMDVNRTILSRAADTVCAPAAGSPGAFPAPLALSQLPSVCPGDQSTTLRDSSPPSSAGSTHAPSTPGPFTPLLSTAPSSQAVTKAPSHPVRTPSRAGGAGAAASTTVSTAGPRNSSAASPAWTEHEPTASHVLDPNISAASLPPTTSKHRGLLPASRNPLSIPRHYRTTQATPQAPHPSPSEDGIPVLVLDDYSEEEEEEEEGKGEKVSAPPQGVACDYHPCKHLQTPCAELQRRLKCQCPGFSQEDTIPDPPKLQGVSEITDTSALVRWCAPNSVVRSYQVRYSAEGWPGNQSAVGDIYATARHECVFRYNFSLNDNEKPRIRVIGHKL